MAITKRTPRGPRLPRSIKARDVLLAFATKIRAGQSSNSQPIQSKSVESESSAVDSDSSFSPSQIHPSRLPPYLRGHDQNTQRVVGESNDAQNTPIALLSIDSLENSQNPPTMTANCKDAAGDSPVLKSTDQNGSATSSFVERVDEALSNLLAKAGGK